MPFKRKLHRTLQANQEHKISLRRLLSPSILAGMSEAVNSDGVFWQWVTPEDQVILATDSQQIEALKRAIEQAWDEDDQQRFASVLEEIEKFPIRLMFIGDASKSKTWMREEGW
jgi:hypothetical protein